MLGTDVNVNVQFNNDGNADFSDNTNETPNSKLSATAWVRLANMESTGGSMKWKVKSEESKLPLQMVHLSQHLKASTQKERKDYDHD